MASFKAPSLVPTRKRRPELESGAADQLVAEQLTAVKSAAAEQLQQSGDHVVGEEGVEAGTDSPVGDGTGGSNNATEEVDMDSRPKESDSLKPTQQENQKTAEKSDGVRTARVAAPHSAPLPSAPLPSAPLPSAPLPSAPLPSAPLPSAPLPSAPLPSLPYTEPHWSGAPTDPYYLTVIKSGSVIEEVDISSKPFQVFGRLPVCDVSLDHPSISRYHAVLQYRPTDAASTGTDGEERGKGSTLSLSSPSEAGFYVYDLNSTHGSFLNKSKLQPRVYYRLRVGQMVRFGGSSRLFVLEVGSGGAGGPGQELVEAEAQAEIIQLQREKEVWETRQREREEERERLAREREEMGATWGMVMDEVQRREDEEEELTFDPDREAYYKDDPKKALKKFFDREGLELDYEVEEEAAETSRDKSYIARVILPIESGGGGEGMVVEERGRGRKKEAVLQCALKACRILDSHDMLHPASKGRRRLSKNWEENDYYDSDEDSFLDRTGQLDRKRRQRMRRLGKLQEQAESYASLEDRLEELRQQRLGIEARLSKAQHTQVGERGDSLDEYMSVVSSQLDPATVTQLRQQVQELRKEEESVGNLLKIAKPTEMPSIHTSVVGSEEQPTGGSARRQAVSGPSSSSEAASTHPHTASEPRTHTAAPHRKKRRSTSDGGHQIAEAGDSGGGGNEGGGGGGGGEGSGKTPPQKRARVMGPALPPQRKRDMLEQKKEAAEEDDPEFASWLPPDNQTGDGRTHLNEKFGY